MTKLTRILLISGDLTVLLWIVSAGAVAPVQLGHPVELVIRAFLILATFWLFVGAFSGAFTTDRSTRYFFNRAVLTWLLAGAAGIILHRLIQHAGFHFSGILYQWTDSLILLLVWRIVFRTLYLMLHRQDWVRNIAMAGLMVVVGLGLSMFGLKLHLIVQFQDDIYTVETAPPRQTVVVFGAGLWYDGTPSTIMTNRVATGVELYKRGTVDQIIMSGDGRDPQFDETTAMRQLALEAGVPTEDILLDPDGTRTYNTCYHMAHDIDGDDFILVTHGYHLYRALYTCDALGLDVIGVAPVEAPTEFRSLVRRELREVAATALAWWELNINPVQKNN